MIALIRRTKQINVSLRPELHEKLKKYADQEKQTVSGCVSEWVKKLKLKEETEEKK